jgi:hypothetical protein
VPPFFVSGEEERLFAHEYLHGGLAPDAAPALAKPREETGIGRGAFIERQAVLSRVAIREYYPRIFRVETA